MPSSASKGHFCHRLTDSLCHYDWLCCCLSEFLTSLWVTWAVSTVDFTGHAANSFNRCSTVQYFNELEAAQLWDKLSLQRALRSLQGDEKLVTARTHAHTHTHYTHTHPHYTFFNTSHHITNFGREELQQNGLATLHHQWYAHSLPHTTTNTHRGASIKHLIRYMQCLDSIHNWEPC